MTTYSFCLSLYLALTLTHTICHFDRCQVVQTYCMLLWNWPIIPAHFCLFSWDGVGVWQQACFCRGRACCVLHLWHESVFSSLSRQTVCVDHVAVQMIYWKNSIVTNIRLINRQPTEEPHDIDVMLLFTMEGFLIGLCCFHTHIAHCTYPAGGGSIKYEMVFGLVRTAHFLNPVFVLMEMQNFFFFFFLRWKNTLSLNRAGEIGVMQD